MNEKENFLRLLHSEDEQNIALALQILEGNPVFEPLLEKHKKLAEALNKPLLSSQEWKTFLVDFNQKTELDLTNGADSGMKISAVLEQLLHFPPIVRLDLSRNYLYRIPSELCQLTHLQSLRLQGNYLEYLPDDFSNLTSLQVLNLRGNHHFTSLPKGFDQLQNLVKLNLVKNGFSSFPLEITALKELQVLYLSINELTKLPAEIGKLQKLSTLHVDSNQLEVLPPEIGNLANLTDLYLDGNRLAAIPPEIGNLKKLQRLNLSQNRLKSLPVEISNLPSLQTLNLQDNVFSTTEEDKIKAWLSHCNITFESDFYEDYY